MPLYKHWRGMRVVRTRRCGNRILVRVVRSPSLCNQRTWFEISSAEYRAELTVEFLASRPT